MPLFRNCLITFIWSLLAHSVYSVLPDDPVQWEYVTGSAIYSSVTLGSDGVAYIGSGDSSVYAINADGTVKWSYQTGDWVDTVPALNEEESVVYVHLQLGRTERFILDPMIIFSMPLIQMVH